MNALLCQRIRCCQCFRDTKSGCNDGAVASLTERHALADLKLIIRAVVDDRNRQSAKAQIHRSHVLVGSLHCRARLDVVRRVDDNHSRDRTHQGNILVALMGRAVFPDGNSGMCRTDLHIQMRISDGIAHLLVRTSCRKHGEGAHKRYKSTCGHSGCHAGHIRLCDTAVNVAVRECLLEHSGLGCRCEIRIQDNQILMLSSKLDQSIAVALSRCNLYF